MPDIKIDDNCLFEVERRLNVYLNSNELEQLENQYAEKLDNARFHAVRLVKNFLAAETIQRMGWIACSLDLNPIECVRDTLRRHIATNPRSFITWRTGVPDFFKSRPVFPKVSSITSSHPCKTDLHMWPRRKAVVEFRLATGHDCLLKHFHRIHVAQAPFCTFCDIWEDIDARL
ncbi:hypothetical protein TNCV_2140331 [Trichonephila clavipes]|uniref:Uncharacterized protein n=1 Tax=Trichonephila clavipes TaxID=2585209 RepID=A0A8X6VAQ9_TRICX|nr:hypothetical protein TNCV_2140331 [Trichonephila clavipes]